MAIEVMVKDVRISFVELWKAKTVGGTTGRPAFSSTFLLAPDNTLMVDLMMQAINQAATERWKEKAPAILAQLWATDKVCLHNGDLKAQYDGFAGNYAISARSYTKPLVIGRRREILEETSGRPYAGCYVTAHLEIWAQDDKDFGKRVNAGLKGVQFIRDGDAFAGGAPSDPGQFDDLGVEDGSSLV